MHVVMVTPEIAPAAKVGGLADVIHGLGREVQQAGHRLEVVVPFYDSLRRNRIADLTPGPAGLVTLFGGAIVPFDVHTGMVHDLPCLFIDPHNDAFRRGRIYGERDDDVRFALFCRAALDLLVATERRPDVIHCHDWATALVPVLLAEEYRARGLAPRTCFTLHNILHQGRTGPDLLRRVGLDPLTQMVPDRLLDPVTPGAANLMKGGIQASDVVTTVSHRYAEEVTATDMGHGLQGVLRGRGADFHGIRNGLDEEHWHPATDSHIPHPFDRDDLATKRANTAALRARLDLADSDGPVVAVVTRLDAQKGVELIHRAVFMTLANGGQFVLLGAALDPDIDARFRDLADRLADRNDCRLVFGHDEDLAHLIYAGADMVVVPSRFEPCGLTQMIGMRYGAVPVARATGGLADTVHDAHGTDPEPTGFTFDAYDTAGLDNALGRALGLWHHHRAEFERLRHNGMARDWSWREPGREYLALYGAPGA